MGTVGYMSPEQASGRAVDFRSDQFSLGSILYELTTGQRAFRRDTHAETMTAIIREEPRPIAQRNAGRAGSLPLDRRALPVQGTRTGVTPRRATSRGTSRWCASTSRRSDSGETARVEAGPSGVAEIPVPHAFSA